MCFSRCHFPGSTPPFPNFCGSCLTDFNLVCLRDAWASGMNERVSNRNTGIPNSFHSMPIPSKSVFVIANQGCVIYRFGLKFPFHGNFRKFQQLTETRNQVCRFLILLLTLITHVLPPFAWRFYAWHSCARPVDLVLHLYGWASRLGYWGMPVLCSSCSCL